MVDFKGPIWDGIFDCFEKVQKENLGFEEKAHISLYVKQAKTDINSYLGNENAIPPFNRRPCSLSMLIAAAYSSDTPLQILDFGGGTGLMYLSVVHETSNKIDYTIIENTGICEAANELFKDNSHIRFLVQIPDNIEIDILYVNSVMQYIGNWKEVISKLCEVSSEYILFDDLYAGDIPNFISTQKYYESLIPHRFFNVESFIEEVEKHNYQLQLKQKHNSPVLGKSDVLPMTNFPLEFQLDYACTLLFRRNS